MRAGTTDTIEAIIIKAVTVEAKTEKAGNTWAKPTGSCGQKPRRKSPWRD